MKVVIRKRPSKVKLPKEVKAEAKQNLSSHFVGRQPMNPLSEQQVKRWMPGIIGLPVTHLDFHHKLREYWAEMTIKVPFGGHELDITCDEKGEPVVLDDYLKYLFAKKHVTCANSKEEMHANPTMTHYIHDESKDIKAKNAVVQLGKLADKAFIKDASNPAKVDAMVRILTNGTNPDSLLPNQRENILYDSKNSNPEKYLKVSQDDSILIKAELIALVGAKVLTKIGSKYIYIDEPIGSTENEAVAWFKDEARNSKVILEMRTKLEEFAK